MWLHEMLGLESFMKKKLISLYRKTKNKWPMPSYDDRDEPHFFFLLTPPNSGSTAIAKLLDSSPRTMMLTPQGEGQWLLPGLCAEDRWDPNKKVNLQSIKSVWLNKYQKEKSVHPKVNVVIEKSPPNMMRIEELAGLFESYSMLANNRDPYANCSSRLFRYHDEKDINSERRLDILVDLAESWIVRSKRIRDLVRKHDIPVLTYEKFCENPALLIEMVPFPDGVAETVILDAQVKVKDYKLQSISNQNERQIACLTATDIERLNEVLEPHRDLLSFFGYGLR